MLEIWIIKILGPNWKSTLQGIAVSVVAIFSIAMGFGIETLGGFFKAFNNIKFDIAVLMSLVPTGIGLSQKDAGTTPVVVPGTKDVENAPSHEVLDDPTKVPAPKDK